VQRIGTNAGEPELMRKVFANWEHLERALVDTVGGMVVAEPRGFRWRTGLHSGFLNGVIVGDLHPDDLAAYAHELRAWFPADLPWRWILPGDPLDTNIGNRLEADGFERRWPGQSAMAAPIGGFTPDAWMPDGGRVTEVASAADLEAWLSVRQVNLALTDTTIAAWRRAHTEFGLGEGSALRHFVGWDGDRAVAGASLFLDEQSGSAGIYHVDVLAEARGRGFGKAVTVAALVAAQGHEYELAVLSASELGRPVYLRLGFEVVGNVTIFVGGAH
jgi:ribosomal protein S18 acetylase RimI-like enzyme